MSIVPAASGSLVKLDTELQLSGLVARIGRASGMIIALSNEIIAQFSEALRTELQEPHAVAKDGGEARRPSRTGGERQAAETYAGARPWHVLAGLLRMAQGQVKRLRHQLFDAPKQLAHD